MEIYVKIFGGDHLSDRNDDRLRQVVVKSSRFMVKNSRPKIAVGILRVDCSLANFVDPRSQALASAAPWPMDE